jgi:hypothetical protein
MTRARANSGRAANRPMAATTGASLPLDASLLSIVANLEGLDLDGLRRQWRTHLGGEAPAHLPRWLLMKVLAYRLQSDALRRSGSTMRLIPRGCVPTHALFRTERQSLGERLHREASLALTDAHAGAGRRAAMDIAEAWLAEGGETGGVILTTDADKGW